MQFYRVMEQNAIKLVLDVCRYPQKMAPTLQASAMCDGLSNQYYINKAATP